MRESEVLAQVRRDLDHRWRKIIRDAEAHAERKDDFMAGVLRTRAAGIHEAMEFLDAAIAQMARSPSHEVDSDETFPDGPEALLRTLPHGSRWRG